MKKTFTFLLISLVISCLPDDLDRPITNGIGNQSDILFQQNFGAPTPADFIGRVVNEAGISLSGVQITIGNAFTSTDQNGIFVLNDVSVFEKFAYVKAFKDGYLKGSRAVVPSLTTSNDIQITLLQKNVVETIESGVETEVVFNDSKVTFQGDFINASGNPYNGQVEVSMHYLKPNTQETFSQMPGMLFAQEEDNDAAALETYGMLNINLFSPSGEELNIAHDSPAIIEFPVDTDQTTIAPETINLWYFDDEVGYWKEEGTATKVGSMYVAEVSHFTWWNCDLPIEYVNVCFELTTESGIRLPNNYLEIFRNQTGQLIFSGYTDQRGEQCGIFPADEQVTMFIYGLGECQDEILHQEVVGPYSDEAYFNVSVPISNIEQAHILATVLNCNGDPLTNGYAFLYSIDENVFNGITLSVDNGLVDTYLQYCANVSNTYNLVIVDIDTEQNTEVLSIDIIPETINLGTLLTCVDNGDIFEGDVILASQIELNNFGSLNFSGINGNLLIGIEDLNNDDSNITNLDALNELNYVTGELRIIKNPDLIYLNGLENLSIVGSLYIGRNENLDNLNVLNNISGTVSDLDILWNDSLEDLSGLNNINTVIDRLYIQQMENLTSLNGLQGLQSIGELLLNNLDQLSVISGIENALINSRVKLRANDQLTNLNGLNVSNELNSIIISYNSQLSNLDALNNVNYVNWLAIHNSPSFTSLEGLENLIAANKVSLFSNDNLISLDGLNNLNSVEEVIIGGYYDSVGQFQDNPNILLSNFCALDNLVTNGSYQEIRIENNAYNPTVQDIIDGNCSQ